MDKTTTDLSFEEKVAAEIMEKSPAVKVTILGPKRLEVTLKHECDARDKFRGMKMGLRFHPDQMWYGTITTFGGRHFAPPFGEKRASDLVFFLRRHI